MSEEEQEAKLELSRYIYGKQLTKDDQVDYISILFGYISKLEKENNSLKQENDFLKQLYSGTEEFKSIERKYKK